MRLPHLRRRRNLRDFAGPGRQPLLPFGDHAGEVAVALQQPLRRRAIGARQHAERIFGGEQFVVGQGAMVAGVAHCSRQLFSLIMARRIQLFMVPSGTLMRAAKSS